MKTKFIQFTTSLAFQIFTCVISAQTTPPTVGGVVSPETRLVTESMPQYPGGDLAMQKDVQANLIYPQAALEKGIEGRVFVQFIVEKDGSISEVKTKKGIPDTPELDAAAEEAVKKLKHFTPATSLSGEPARILMTIPVRFQLKKK